MAAWFVKFLNLSIAASFIAIAVMLVRLIFRKVVPKNLVCMLWMLVAMRLICPFTIESDFSILPASEYVSSTVIKNEIPAYNNTQQENGFTVTVTGEDEYAFPENEAVAENNDSAPITQQKESTVSLGNIAVVVWAIGSAIMLSYMAISYFKLLSKLCACVKLDKNIYLADGISTSFILGIIKPTIYIPSDTAETERKHILSHEKSHIKRLDHIWKPLGYLLLSVNWFNPIMWLSYVLLCRDIEIACDEKVVSNLNIEEKKEYSRVLLRCSVPKNMITACPLAFGENSVKERVKAMKYNKKYTVTIITVFVAICAVCALCLLTVPKTNKSASAESYNKTNSDEIITTSGKAEPDLSENQNTFDNSLPLQNGAKLLTDNSYAQAVTDTDGDGLQDRITYAALSTETSYICVEYGNASKANSTFTLENSVLRPQLTYSLTENKTIVYITDQTADEQNVYPFAISKSGEITPIINKNAVDLTENSILSHDSFVKDSFGEWVDDSLVITYGKPYVVINIPQIITSSKHFDESYGLRFIYKDNSVNVNAENNTIECNVYCAISDIESNTTDVDFTPVTATLTFTYSNESFQLKNINFNTDYPYHTQDTMPTSQPQTTETPNTNESTYAKTITLNGNVTKRIDLDGDGKKETIECKESDAAVGYSALKSIKISSSTGEVLYNSENYFFKKAVVADITRDGRLAIFIVEESDTFDSVSAFFVDGESIQTININGNNSLECYLKSIKDGVVVIETINDILGTHQWYYKAAYNKSTGNIEKVNSSYFCEDDTLHKLKCDTYAYDKEGNKIDIKAGTEFKCYQTDMKTYIKLKDKNGNVYKFDIKESNGENWPYLINGIWQEDLFTGAVYCG